MAAPEDDVTAPVQALRPRLRVNGARFGKPAEAATTAPKLRFGIRAHVIAPRPTTVIAPSDYATADDYE